MEKINWQDDPSPEAPSASANKSTLPSSFWMASTMVLVGIIIGFSMGKFTGGRATLNEANSLRQAAEAGNLPESLPLASAPKGRITPPTSASLPAIDLKKDHIRGNLNAQIAVVEYSDFECPFCKRVHPTLQKILDVNVDKVMWVYRHFPLDFHANAQKEAEASECAAELGGNDVFWKYADGIFAKTTSNGTGFPLDQLVPLAKEIGLNQKKFKECLDSGKYAQHVKEDAVAGVAAGVTGTPGNFVVNMKTQKNQVVEGAQPYGAFQSAIDAMSQ